MGNGARFQVAEKGGPKALSAPGHSGSRGWHWAERVPGALWCRSTTQRGHHGMAWEVILPKTDLRSNCRDLSALCTQTVPVWFLAPPGVPTQGHGSEPVYRAPSIGPHAHRASGRDAERRSSGSAGSTAERSSAITELSLRGQPSTETAPKIHEDGSDSCKGMNGEGKGCSRSRRCLQKGAASSRAPVCADSSFLPGDVWGGGPLPAVLKQEAPEGTGRHQEGWRLCSPVGFIFQHKTELSFVLKIERLKKN